MDKQIWTDWRISKPCPKCYVGRITPIDKKYDQTETRESAEIHSDEPSYPYSDYLFTEHLRCDNCGEVVTAMGTKSEDDYPSQDGDHNVAIVYISVKVTPLFRAKLATNLITG